MWVDADTIFNRFDVNVLNEVSGDESFYIHSHFHSVHQVLIPNSGVFLVKNSKWSRDFLEQIWAQDDLVNHPWWENAALVKAMGQGKLIDGSENKSDPHVSSHIGKLSEQWNCIPWQQTVEDPVIWHFPGSDRAYRQATMPRLALAACFRHMSTLKTPPR